MMTTLTLFPPAPSTSDESTFDDRADGIIAHLQKFVPEINTLINELNSLSQTIIQKEASAVSSSDISSQAKDVCVMKANLVVEKANEVLSYIQVIESAQAILNITGVTGVPEADISDLIVGDVQ